MKAGVHWEGIYDFQDGACRVENCQREGIGAPFDQPDIFRKVA